MGKWIPTYSTSIFPASPGPENRGTPPQATPRQEGRLVQAPLASPCPKSGVLSLPALLDRTYLKLLLLLRVGLSCHLLLVTLSRTAPSGSPDCLTATHILPRTASKTIQETSQASILEWIAMPSSRESSQPRDQTQISLTAGGFFTV